MLNVVKSLALTTLVSSQVCNKYETTRDTRYEDITYGRTFERIASSTKTDAVWAVLRKKHKSDEGYQLAKLDNIRRKWIEDPTQPKGAFGPFSTHFAVDKQGMPAFAQVADPRHIWHKQGENWKEYKACSHGVAFGPYDKMFRIGCDYKVY